VFPLAAASCVVAAAALPPKVIGLNSLHRHAHTPIVPINAALENCSAHHSQFSGSPCEYTDTRTRCIKCSVSTKSGTSFERWTMKRIAITLLPVSHFALNPPILVSSVLAQ
jgi:hypothetical protein